MARVPNRSSRVDPGIMMGAGMPVKGRPDKIKSPVKRAVKRPAGGRAIAARSGGNKVDELLGGGFPFKSNILVQGPAFVGKDALLTQFVSEGIKTGAPCIVILTHSTTSQMRKKIVEMDHQIQEREKQGLITYIDCYSKTAGLMGKNPFALYLKGVDDIDALSDAIERFQIGYKEKYFYHRLIFDSLSTVVRTHGLNRTMDFLHGLKAKTNAYSGIALLDLVGGIHQPDEISSLESIVDGTVLMKEEKGKYFMMVKGLPNAKSREWMEYQFSDQGIDIKGIYSYSYIQ
ncbi:MAG: RAD55 family ATPase [Thermoplasmatota archaeon]